MTVVVGPNSGNASYSAQSYVPAMRPASPKPSLRNALGVDSSRPILSKMQGSLSCSVGISASAPEHGGSSRLTNTFAGRSISAQQPAGLQPSLSHVPCRAASVARPQMSLTYVGPVLNSSPSSAQTNMASSTREAMQSRFRSARSPAPPVAHPLAHAGGVASRGRSQAAIKTARTASPSKQDIAAMELSVNKACRTESNVRGSVAISIERSFTQVPFCGALMPVPASPLLGVRFASPSPRMRAASPQAVNNAGARRTVAVPLIHFSDERTDQSRPLSQERCQRSVVHRSEQVDPIRRSCEGVGDSCARMCKDIAPRAEIESAEEEDAREDPPQVEHPQTNGNLPGFQASEWKIRPIPNSADLDTKRPRKAPDIAPFSPSESLRSAGTLDPNPPSEYGSLTASPMLPNANSRSTSDHPRFEGKTAALVAEAVAKADKSAVLVNQATAKALEEALARVKELEAALSEERRTTEELKETFASELMNQHSAHERDIKALEETVMKLMSDKDQLNALLERSILPKSENADIVSSRDPTSSSSKDTTAGGGALGSLEEPKTC